MAHDVFISCTAADKPVGDAICATLEQNSIRCWIAPRDIAPGADWGETIIKAIASARILILVFSAKANASEHIKREVERAVNAGLPIIPVRIEDVMPKGSLEYFLSTPHWLDAFTGELAEHLEKLVRVVRTILDQPQDKPVVLPLRKEPPKPVVSRPRTVVLQRPAHEAGVSKGCFGITITVSIVATLAIALFVFVPGNREPNLGAASQQYVTQSAAAPEAPSTGGRYFLPSFDCHKDRHWDEQAVCRSRYLSEFDQQMAALYQAAIAASADEAERQALKQDQRAWLHTRAACKTAADPAVCLSELYRARIAALSRRQPAQ